MKSKKRLDQMKSPAWFPTSDHLYLTSRNIPRHQRTWQSNWGSLNVFSHNGSDEHMEMFLLSHSYNFSSTSISTISWFGSFIWSFGRQFFMATRRPYFWTWLYSWGHGKLRGERQTRRNAFFTNLVGGFFRNGKPDEAIWKRRTFTREPK